LLDSFSKRIDREWLAQDRDGASSTRRMVTLAGEIRRHNYRRDSRYRGSGGSHKIQAIAIG